MEKLNLSNNSIQKEDLEHLGNLLKSFKNLKELNLWSNKIDDDGVKILCEIIKNVPNNLTWIDLKDNPISENGVKMLRELEREKPELQIILPAMMNDPAMNDMPGGL